MLTPRAESEAAYATLALNSTVRYNLLHPPDLDVSMIVQCHLHLHQHHLPYMEITIINTLVECYFDVSRIKNDLAYYQATSSKAALL